MAIIVNPKSVKVEEMENSSVISLTIEDESKNETKFYFTDYKTYINFSQIIRQCGTYGNQYSLTTGEKIN